MSEQPNLIGDLIIYQREFDGAVKAGLLSQEGWGHLYGILASINAPGTDTTALLWRQPRDLATISYYSLHFRSRINVFEEAVKDRMTEAELEARKFLISKGMSKPTQTQVNSQMRSDKHIKQWNASLITLRHLHSMVEGLEKVIVKRGSHVEQISNNERLRQRIDQAAHV